MPRPTIENLRGLPDFAPMYKWNVEIATPPKSAPTPPTLNFQCLSSEIPKMDDGQDIEILIRGHKIFQPGIYNYVSSLTLKFVETIDNPMNIWFMQWRDAVWQPGTGIQEMRKDTQAVLNLFRLNRQDVPIWRYEVIGCFLKGYDPSGGELDGEASEILRPELTLTYDYFKDYPMSGGGASVSGNSTSTASAPSASQAALG